LLLGFKTELRLNNKQRTLAAQHAGVARHAYNWGLELCKQAVAEKRKIPTAVDLHKKLVAEVKRANPWYYQVSKCAPQEALRNLERAIKRWRAGKSRFPVFKKKGKLDSFYLEGGIRISGNKIKVPIFGWLACYEVLPAVVPKNVVISRRAHRWFISFKYEAPEPGELEKEGDVVGVDLGVNNLATCSDGGTFGNPKPYCKARKRLRRLQRRLSRKVKGSQNRRKAVKKVARLHKRVVDIRRDNLHKLTTYLAKRYRVVIIEDLNVSGMLKNHKLASSLAECSFYEFRRQLEYKARLYSCQVVVADRFYPSSQLCSCCQHKQQMPLHQRVFRCESCGLEKDRDLNAAINLVGWYFEVYLPSTTPSLGGSHACGDPAAGVGLQAQLGKGRRSRKKASTLVESPLLSNVV